MSEIPVYRRLAGHYQESIRNGQLAPGARFPSMRALMAQHQVSLSTAINLCRELEREGWLEARPRSGNFVRRADRDAALPLREPQPGSGPDPAQYVGIHARVSEFVALCRQTPVRINLSRARCSPTLYPGEALRQSAARVLRRHPELLVTGGSHNGHPEFRATLVRRALATGMLLAPEEIVVTHGCIEALNLALRAVTRPGDVVAVESPTFFGLLQILESLGLRALEVPTSPQTGISLEALELAIQQGERIAALVVVPHLQNPLGACLPDERKAALVRLCAGAGIPLIEDDTYSALHDAAPQRALKSWDESGNVMHCASLHKVLAPGMRLGWLTGGRWQARVEMLKHAQTHFNEELSQLAAAEYIASPAYDRHLRHLRAVLGEQRRRMRAAVIAAFPPGTRLNAPPGGLTLWVELPDGRSARRLFDAARPEGILFAPGMMFSNSERYNAFLRLNCGWLYSDGVDQALRRLGELAHATPPA
jgi:DNA-binding transcriptional MocR family regulator